VTPSSGTRETEGGSEREVARGIVRTLVAGGFTAYFAGGCVRDELLGVEPKDFDVATDARPNDIARLFPSAQPVGEAFAVMLVHRDGRAVQVASFRSDGPYSDQRRPDHVSFADERQDAARRDFTINGLFLDPETGRVIDYVDGQSDLRRRIVRAIGDADERLSEDHLRMLRAVRFAARYGFDIEETTAAAIRRHAPRLRGISRERIGQEIRWMMQDASRARAVELLCMLDLEQSVLIEPRRDHSLPVVRRLGRLEEVRGASGREVSVPLSLAAWYGDRDDVPGRAGVARWSRALVLSNAEKEGLAVLVALPDRLCREWSGYSGSERRRLAGSEWFGDGLHLLRAAGGSEAALEEEISKWAGRFREGELLPDPFVRGDDLIAMGLQSGPLLGRVLGLLYDEQLEGVILDRDAALRRAEEMVRRALDAPG